MSATTLTRYSRTITRRSRRSFGTGVGATLLLCTGACIDVAFHSPPDGATMIPVRGELNSRYFLLEREQIPTGHLNAIVLQQAPDGSPGIRVAYQINCSRGPAWTIKTEADSVTELRRMPVGDEFLRVSEATDPEQQIATWICR